MISPLFHPHKLRRVALWLSVLPVTACGTIPMPAFMEEAFPSFARTPSTVEQPENVVPPAARAQRSVATTSDVEQPEVFQATDLASWDGRPTLGDIWISVPHAIQPERVMIRNEVTGKTIQGAMFVRDTSPDSGAPIRLSTGAAKALGMAPLETARISVTAIRRAPPVGTPPSMLARSDTGPSVPRVTATQPLTPAVPNPPVVSFVDPYLEPVDENDGFVEVAQAIDPEGATRVQDHLQAAAIPAEVQEDYFGGRPVYRVFASAGVDHNLLGGTLENIRFSGGAQGSDDGTLIAELPAFTRITDLVSSEPQWMEMGTYASRNEALSVVQKLSRTATPAEVCPIDRNGAEFYRVFAGPAESKATIDLRSDETPITAEIESVSFCLGVAAGETVAKISNAVPARAPLETPHKVNIPDGAVRIRVGEGTGSLRLKIPNPYSQPVKLPVAGTSVILPPDTSPELVDKIRTVLSVLDKLEPETDGGPLK